MANNDEKSYEQLDLFYAESLEEEKKVTEQDLQEMHDKENKVKKLTDRHWALLELIKHNSFVEKRKTTQKEICDKLSEHGYEWVETSGENHDHCTTIWNDIATINLSYETDKMIISDKYHYWIGDKTQTDAFMDKLWSDLFPRLQRYWRYNKKLARDGQYQMVDRKGNVIEEGSKARRFIESYGKEAIQ